MADEHVWQSIIDAPIPDKWLREALPLWLTPHDMKRILGWEYIYRQVLDVHGEFFQFGVGYGRDLNILACLRHWLEPHVPRRIVGFDTFAGIPEGDVQEGVDGPKAEPGYYGFPEPEQFKQFLVAMLRPHVHEHPSSDRTQFTFVEGKAQDTLPEFLKLYHGAIALASFDMLVYEPTRRCLEAVLERMPAGAIMLFNQFHTPGWTGEAVAFREVVGMRGARLLRVPTHRYWAYAVL